MEGRLYRKFGIWTIIAVYLLILIGGIVRATGSGMGCPDWPKCFGSWVPPTDVSQLPTNYKEIFGAKLKGEVIFNPLKTWTEYINRLVGVSIGLLIFATFVVSFFEYRKKDKVITYLSFIAFLLVGFEGWLGAKVVSNELLPSMVTIHMLVSIVIVFVLLYALMRSYKAHLNTGKVKDVNQINFILTILILLTIGQVIFGTQVRELVDIASFKFGEEKRHEWIESIGGKYYFHAFFSILVLSVNLYLYSKINKSTLEKGLINQYSKTLLLFTILEILAGVILGIFAIPAIVQPAHLTISVILLGFQFILALMVNRKAY